MKSKLSLKKYLFSATQLYNLWFEQSLEHISVILVENEMKPRGFLCSFSTLIPPNTHIEQKCTETLAALDNILHKVVRMEQRVLDTNAGKQLS